MSSDALHAAIRAHLEANWTSTPLAWENEAFEPPTDGLGNPTPWVMVEIGGDLYAQASIGAGSAAANLWREEGLVWFHVFVAAGTGSALARQHARALVDLFRGLTLAGGAIRFRDASIGRGEPGDEDGKFWRISASVEWQRDS